MTTAGASEKITGLIFDRGGQVLNVQHPDFGAKGDGATLEDTAISAAITAANPGDTIFFPYGSYLIDSIVLNKAGLTFAGYGATLIKSGTTANHMFRDTAGLADELTFIGFSVDLKRSLFSTGQTVSFYFGIRADILTFRDLKIRHGIEEGLKFYKCTDVKVVDTVFDDFYDNGIQFHSPVNDAYTGIKADQDADGLYVSGCYFSNIDDGLFGTGNGIGVAIQGTSASVTTRRVTVANNFFKDCLRAAWAENNTSLMKDIVFANNICVDSIGSAFGIVGVNGGIVQGNMIRDPGQFVVNPPTTSSEIAGVYISGSAAIDTFNVIVKDNNIIESRSGGAERMTDGIYVARGQNLLIRDNPTIAPSGVPELTIANGWADVVDSTILRQVIPAVKVGVPEVSGGTPTIPNDTLTTVEWSSPDYDTDGMHSTVTNPHRLTPQTPGRYHYDLSIPWPTDATGYRMARVVKDNGTTSVDIKEDTRNAVSGENTSQAISGDVDLAIGEWLFVQVKQNSGGSLNLGTTEKASFSCHLITGDDS